MLANDRRQQKGQFPIGNQSTDLKFNGESDLDCMAEAMGRRMGYIMTVLPSISQEKNYESVKFLTKIDFTAGWVERVSNAVHFETVYRI